MTVSVLPVASLENYEFEVDGGSSGLAYLLLDLEPINHGGEIAQNLVGLLVELELSSDQVGKVAQRLRSVKDLAVPLC